ncbi:MAG TPA: thermonuclease family protein [Fervidobacterium sp.]|nr:thermonuclease family protein [Fervidobacterium sp.]HPC24623.1 thermonuclease family protein [Fervidobacterium sp.]HQG01665.1 thermonuclease family protein [Fervidobacterium sp.]HQI08734.1 thermonuclease family protein [Fervidobacterium sp.]HQQ17785.1 thermonuclease family protein [Fervidobacterium sp.]
MPPIIPAAFSEIKEIIFERNETMDVKRLIPLLFFAFLFTFSSCMQTSIPIQTDSDVIEINQPLEDVDISYVIDGDTFKVVGSDQSVRIVGIDTPEIHDSSKPIGEYGEEAKEYFEDFAQEYDVYIKKVGTDTYGRTLAYVFGKVDENEYAFYESSVVKQGLARPLIYDDNADQYLTPKIVQSYNKAFEDKVGIFSKWDNAPVLTNAQNYKSYLGKIVFLEGKVTSVTNSNGWYNIYSDWFRINIREEEYQYLFNNYNLYNLKGKTVRFYGELWDENGRPEILLRSPNEILFN